MKHFNLERELRKKSRPIYFVKAARMFLWALSATLLGLYLLIAAAYFVPFPAGVVRSESVLSFLTGAPVLLAFMVFAFRRTDVKTLSETLEKTYPHLHDRLRTAAEIFASNKMKGNAYQIAFARGLEREIRELINRFHFGKAAAWPTLIPPFRCLFFVTVILGIHLSLAPQFFVTAYDHLLGETLTAPPSLWIPKKTEARAPAPPLPDFEIEVSPGSCDIAKGADLGIRALIRGYNPKQVELHLKQNEEPSWRILPMKRESEGNYEYLLTHLNDPSVYYVRADHKKSAAFQIRVLEPLKVNKSLWRLEFPSYMKLLEQRRQGWHEKMTVPAGTKLFLTLEFSQPVMSAWLEAGEGHEIILKQNETGGWEAAFTANRDRSIRLNAKNEKGEPLLGFPSLALHVLPDLMPYLEVLEPQLQNYVFPAQEIPFEIEVNDDYGIRSVDLVLKWKDQEKRLEWLGAGPKEKDFILKPILELEQIPGLEGGDMVFAYVEVRDNYPGPDSHSIRSPLYVFLIRDYVEQFKIKGPESDIPSIRKIFDSVLVAQEQIMKATWDYLSTQPEKTK